MKIKTKYSSETSFDSQGLHDIVSQKIELFNTMAVRPYNPTSFVSNARCIPKIHATHLSEYPRVTSKDISSASLAMLLACKELPYFCVCVKLSADVHLVRGQERLYCTFTLPFIVTLFEDVAVGKTVKH